MNEELGVNDDETDEAALSAEVEAPQLPDEPTSQVAGRQSFEGRRVFVGTGVVWGLVAGILLAILLLIVIAQNTQRATVEFLGWDFSTPLIVLILAVLVIGVALDELVGLVYRARKRRSLRDRDELERLRTTSEGSHSA